MSSRDDLHRLVDLLDDDALPDPGPLVTTYADLPLGAVDVSVLALAERFNDLDVATLDRRHFTILRPSRGRILTLHPAF